MKQTYLIPNTVFMNLCGEFLQIVCTSVENPSTPSEPVEGTEVKWAPKKMV